MNTIAAMLAADWPIDTVAYFAVDYDGGSDANIGFSLVSMAAAGAAPMKTLQQLFSIFPQVGNGRIAVIAIKPRAAGATYRNKANTADDDLDLRGIGGYRRLLVRATGDGAGNFFTNTTADKTVLGGLQAQVGPNGDGSFTVTAGATTSSMTIAAGALTAEPALVGKRVRFTGNVTGALANQCRMIWQNTGSVITPSTNFSGAPANGDTFYVEGPAVRVGRILGSNPLGYDLAFTDGGVTVAGVGSTSASATTGFLYDFKGDFSSFAFVESAANAILVDCGQASNTGTYTDETGASFTPGPAIRVTTTFSIQRGILVTLQNCAAISSAAQSTANQSRQVVVGFGCYFGAGFTFVACGTPASGDTATNSCRYGNASSGTAQRARSVAAVGNGAIDINNSNVSVRGANITGCGGLPGIFVQGVGANLTVNDAVGSTGNTDVGIDVSNASQIKAGLGKTTANTVTGTLGDIRVAGTAITTHAGLTTTNVIDNQANNLVGTGGQVVSSSRLVVNKSGGALVVGNIVRKNGTTQQVTSAKADTQANATGVLGVMVTPPANNANGYMSTTGPLWVKLDGAPTIGNLCYLSEANAGQGKDAPPAAAATNQKLRNGYIQESSGTMGLVVWETELVPILSDGVAP